jgi:hypothetical protein
MQRFLSRITPPSGEGARAFSGQAAMQAPQPMQELGRCSSSGQKD